jgi:3-methyladenine DNA glycosylase/8-oxoguanine DNA glycosylase
MLAAFCISNPGVVHSKGKKFEGIFDLKTVTIALDVPENFNFRHTIFSHGWCVLPPFRVDSAGSSLERLLSLSGGGLVQCSVRENGKGKLCATVQSPGPLMENEKREIVFRLRDCLRLDEDLSPFYREVRRYPKYRWIAGSGAGRMLRAPSVFEDVVKMICTTNCSWALTETMIANIVRELGKKFDGMGNSFPAADVLAGVTEAFLRKKIRAGYRAPFLLEFAEKVADGKLDIERWRSPELPAEELFKQLRSIKGVGDYAAGNLLKLLGRYDHLGLDSWVRGRYYELYHKGRRVGDATIEKRYAQYGKWRGLVFWLEMTRHWMDQKTPL